MHCGVGFCFEKKKCNDLRGGDEVDQVGVVEVDHLVAHDDLVALVDDHLVDDERADDDK